MAMFYGPLQWFAAVLNWMSSAFAGAERVFNILDQPPEDTAASAADAATLPPIVGTVEFHEVSFSYERGKEVLKGVTFTAEQLQWLAWMKEAVASDLGLTSDSFDYTPFTERGGIGKAAQVFGDRLTPLMEELTEVLAA